jgi:alpha-beta hydrolase superfamily lysophospholipase
MPVDDIAAAGTIAAHPTFIGGAERSLFCWHHAPAPGRRRGAGVLICPPLGYEYMSSYRTLRILAEELAELGFDALRLDYDSTGNSYDSCEDADRVDAWVRSIRSGLDETRRVAGSNAIAVVGLRAGGLLALQALAGSAIERLVLWNPFVSGRAYVRELTALARLSQGDDADDNAAGEDASGDVINAEGHAFTRQTLETLSAWTVHDLAAAPASDVLDVLDVLIIDRDDRPVDAALQSHLTLLGSRVTRRRLPGTAEMLAPPHLSKVPRHTVDEITSWLGASRVSANVSGVPSIPSDPVTAAGARVLRRPDFVDEAVYFGQGGRLFGMLASPGDSSQPLPALLLFNTGAGHHVGPHRMYAPLARKLAARGHVVLRFDLRGIGDSAPLERETTEPRAYPPQMLDDAREAVAFLRSRAPGRKLIAAGLCSGGWLAFQVARAGLDVDEIVSVNPPLYLRDGAAGVAWVQRVRELERYRQSMRQPGKWVKGLRGRASYASFIRIVASALARRVRLIANGRLGTPLTDGLAKDLCAIASRGIRTRFVFSRGDNGLAYFNRHAPAALRRRQVRALIDHVLVDGAGHVFRPFAAQQALRRVLTEWVSGTRI